MRHDSDDAILMYVLRMTMLGILGQISQMLCRL
jgi:hypothetical protein